MKFSPFAAVALVSFILGVASSLTPDFSYDAARPIDLKIVSTEKRGAVEVRDVTFANLAGGRTAAYWVVPPGEGKVAGTLYVHWFEPPNPTSNRTQYLNEAVALAEKGQTSLLIETMWSDPEWFGKRLRKDDYAISVAQVKELRRALDVLLSNKRVDPKRVAYVGHDFGAMYGAVLAGIDPRPQVWALQAGTTRFSDWFLYATPKTGRLEGDEKQKFIDELAPLDPVKYIGRIAGKPLFLQFARKDVHVPKAKAEEFFAAAGEPKKIEWYEGGHGLEPKAIEDRKAWLTEQLKLQ